MGEPVTDWKKFNSINTIEELEIELKRMELKERGSLREFRKFYSKALFVVTILWILIVLAIVILDKNLSDKVLITLITTTTVNVFAFFLLVVKYMFAVPNSPHSKPTTEKK